LTTSGYPHFPRFGAPSPLLRGRAEALHALFLESLSVPGDVAELGVFEGHTSRRFVHDIEARGLRKTVHLFDSFHGLPDIVTSEERKLAAGHELREGNYASALVRTLTTLNGVRQFQIHEGLFEQSLPRFERSLCFIHVDADLYQSTVEAIFFADRCLEVGGSIVFDDYGDPLFPGVTLAVSRFLDSSMYRRRRGGAGSQYVAIRFSR
jgi:O-methyltransferase